MIYKQTVFLNNTKTFALRKKLLTLFSVSLGFVLTVCSQNVTTSEQTNADTVLINSLLQQSKESLNESPEKTITLARQAKNLSEKANFKRGEALALKNIGLGYYYQSKYIETLDYWNQSLKIFESLQDQIGVANLLNNIGAIYTNQGDDAKGLEYSLKSLEISEKTGDKLRILSALNSLGTIYNNKGEGAIDENKKVNWDKALKYLLMALPLCEELGNSEGVGIISGNIGEIYFKENNDVQALKYFNKSLKASVNTANSSFAYNGIGKLYLRKGDFDKALAYHQQAYDIARKLDNQLNMMRSLQGMAAVYLSQKNFKQALVYFNQAKNIAEEIHSQQDLKDIYQEIAIAYKNAGDYKNAFAYQTKLSQVKDTLYNAITEKKLGALQFDFDLQKKQTEINLLIKDKDLASIKIKRQKLAKNAFMIGLFLAFMIALLIFRNYRIKVKTNKILDQQKGEIENLLLNILPAEVANELQVKGHADPKYYESVSVMFTDFKGFTTIADKMLPQDLLHELNVCFMAFDGIIEKHNLEKIKTIGDSYMCAGGIPTPSLNHVENMIKASLEVRDFTRQYNQNRKEAGLETWDLRIGIHVGPIVAGVVGRKKYAYDIWGSTVNIASRMESNSVAGEVNISASTYELVKHKYACKYRGKIYAKNVGEIDMYFVEGEVVDSKQQTKIMTSEIETTTMLSYEEDRA
jgi:class 3 adenylate cyclase/tetratricopeptide (TPR) repeat protein